VSGYIAILNRLILAGLSVHLSQVHKEQLNAVDNALPNRSSLDIEIFGMEGLPEDIVQAHNQRVLTQYQQAEAERRAATGNPPSGVATEGGQAKKPKLELSDLKKRLADHKAKMAEKAAGGSSGDATPVGAGQSAQTPSGFAVSGALQVCLPVHVPDSSSQSQPPQYAQGQQPVSNVGNSSASNQQPSYPQPYGTANSPFQQAQSPVYQNYSPNGQHQQQYGASQFASPPPFQPGHPPAPYGATPSPLPFAPQQPGRTHTPPQTLVQYPPRPGSLPPAPGLPQRPAFGAPQVNAHQMQQMHQGQAAPAVQPASSSPYGQHAPSGDIATPIPGHAGAPISSSVDDLISGAARAADDAAAQASSTARLEPAEEKKSKKEKEKAKTRLVYSDNQTSPEEKMANLPRYAYVPDHRSETVLAEATTAAVSRPPISSDDVIDPAG
jgi:hypothetical protein